MPWRPIQTATAGWLSLLGLKNLGRNPDEVLEQVRPTTEMTGFWLRGISEYEEEDFTMAFASESWYPTFGDVPENEWRFFQYFWMQCVSPGGGSNVVRFGIYKDIPGNSKLIWRSAMVSSVPAAGVGVGTAELRDFWVPPGFRVQVEAYGAIADVITAGGLFSRVRV